MAKKRYCGMCDEMVTTDGRDCAKCGFETSAGNPYADPREKGDDDGVEYGDPRDHRDGRE